MQTATHTPTRRSHSTQSGVSLKKLRRIAEGLNRRYLMAGGTSEIEFDIEAIRKRIGDSVAEAFEVLEKLERGSVPNCLLPLLPDDDAAFELRCQAQPQADPSDPDAPEPMVEVTMPTAALPGRCPRCQYRFTVPGETCPNCDDDDDGRAPVAAEQPKQPVQGRPRPEEGFQFCPSCRVGEALLGGGRCNNCGEYVEPHESTFPSLRKR